MNRFDIALPIGPRTIRPDVDAAKLARLQAARYEARAVLDSVNRQRQADRDDLVRALMFFPASTAAASFWRPGDDPVIFTEMTGEQAVTFKAEAQAARDIAHKREALGALTARADQLAARLSKLNQLVAACETYAYGKE